MCSRLCTSLLLSHWQGKSPWTLFLPLQRDSKFCVEYLLSTARRAWGRASICRVYWEAKWFAKMTKICKNEAKWLPLNSLPCWFYGTFGKVEGDRAALHWYNQEKKEPVISSAPCDYHHCTQLHWTWWEEGRRTFQAVNKSTRGWVCRDFAVVK